MGKMTKGELMRETATWKQAHFSAVMSGSLQDALHRLKGKWGRRSLLPKTPTLQHPGGSAYMMSGDLSLPLWGLPLPHLGPLAYMAIQASGTLHVGPHACWASTRPPVAWLYGINCHIWGTTPGVLLSTNLPKECECSFHRSPHQSHCWQGHSNQQGTISGPPDRNPRRVHPWPPEMMDPGGNGPPGCRAQRRTGTGQGTAAQIGTPVCPQWPRPGENIPD